MREKNTLKRNRRNNKFYEFVKKSINTVCSRLELMVLPVGLILLLVLGFLWNFSQSNIEVKQLVPIKVWEQKAQLHDFGLL